MRPGLGEGMGKALASLLLTNGDLESVLFL